MTDTPIDPQLEKLKADLNLVIAQTSKLNRELPLVELDTRKRRQDLLFAPWFVGAAIATAGATIFAGLLALLHAVGAVH